MVQIMNMILVAHFLRPSSDKRFSQAIFWWKDKAILQYIDKAIFFLSKYCCCFSTSAEITMNWDFQFSWRKNIAGFYGNIALFFIAILPVKTARVTQALKWQTSLFARGIVIKSGSILKPHHHSQALILVRLGTNF